MALSGKGKSIQKANQEGPDKLPYRVELWKDGSAERVLARAANANLARAIYSAAGLEHPEDTIVLSRGTKIIVRTK